MNKFFIVGLCLSMLFLNGCGGGHELKRTGYYLDSMVDVNVRIKNSREVRAQGEKLSALTFGKLIELDTNLNKLSPISEISAINGNAGFRMVEVGEMTYDLLKKSLAGAAMMDGYFDVTWSPLVRLFDRGGAAYGQIEAAKRAISYQNIQLDTNVKRVRFMNNATELDFDHIKRGYAVDMVVADLAHLKIKTGYVKVGLITYYYNTKREKMKFNDGTYVKLKYKKCGVATIGAEDYYQNANFWKRYLPVKTTDEDIISVTAIAPNATTAEVIANACFFLGTENAIAKVKELKAKSAWRGSYDVVIVYKENDKEHAVSTLKVRGRRH